MIIACPHQMQLDRLREDDKWPVLVQAVEEVVGSSIPIRLLAEPGGGKNNPEKQALADPLLAEVLVITSYSIHYTKLYEFNRVLIFVRTKEHADHVFKIIKRKSEGEKRILHSNKGQSSRINAINAFKEGEVRIMISTDVSARGLDVSLISHVINFDLPQRYEDYVHRIGRTARANNHGEAITLVDPAEEYHLKKIEQIIRMEIPEREIPVGVEMVDSYNFV